MTTISGLALTKHTFAGPITAKNASAASSTDSFKQLLSAAANEPTAKTAEVKPAEKVQDSSTVQAFKNYMKQTPAEKMEEAWLKRHGLTKDDLKAMSPAEQTAIRDQMAKELKEEMAEAAGKHEPVNLLA